MTMPIPKPRMTNIGNRPVRYPLEAVSVACNNAEAVTSREPPTMTVHNLGPSRPPSQPPRGMVKATRAVAGRKANPPIMGLKPQVCCSSRLINGCPPNTAAENRKALITAAP